MGYGESDKSFPRGGFGVMAVFSLALSFMAQIFSPFFLPAGSGLFIGV